VSVTHKPKGGALLTGTEYEAADSHVVVLADADIPATIARDAEVTTAVSNHAAAADPHTGYRLETEDHSHASTGLQAGTVAHSVLTGNTATDHHVAPAAGPDANTAVDVAGAAGTASTFARSGHGHQLVTTAGPGADAVVDGTGAAGATGAVARASHGHQVQTSATLPVALGVAAAGTTGAIARSTHVHPTTGLALDPHGAAQHTDITRQLFLAPSAAKLDSATAVNLGASPNLTGAVAYADAATQGAIWTFAIPSDWASGVITIQPVWSPGSTDAVAHTVRWSMTCKNVAAGTTITAAGTTVAFTGSSAARTVAVIVKDTATSTTLTPAAANDLFTITLQRIGADAADTYVGVVNLIGILVTYTASQ